MMTQSSKYEDIGEQELQVISLPFGTGRFGLYIFLPAIDVSLADLLNRLTENWDDWGYWMKSTLGYDGTRMLPRFKMTYDVTLNDALSALGMGIAFSRDAHFSAMCPGVFRGNVRVAEVKHKTLLEVNEEGAEAAAVTKVTMMRGDPPLHSRWSWIGPSSRDPGQCDRGDRVCRGGGGTGVSLRRQEPGVGGRAEYVMDVDRDA